MLEDLSTFTQLLLEPFGYFTSEHKRIYWPYLLSAFLMALGVQLWRRSTWRRALIGVIAPRHWSHPSSGVDLQWILVNHLLSVLLVVPLIGGQVAFAMMVNKWLYGHFGEGNILAWGALWTSMVFTVIVFICDDFTRFYLHYLYHRVPWLWRFHAIHHSATVMTPLTLYRIHSIEMAINSCRSLVVIGGLSGVFIYVIDGNVALVQVLGVSAFAMFFNLAGANLRHSHIRVGFGPLESWFISPAQHQIHHSTAQQHFDTNYGATLAIWDRWFGSWVASKDQHIPGFGLPGKSAEQRWYRQLLGL
jgi:sterol desaturase/sphingolipid hydroxylase (fatty acid hydroxylase superfamily)